MHTASLEHLQPEEKTQAHKLCQSTVKTHISAYDCRPSSICVYNGRTHFFCPATLSIVITATHSDGDESWLYRTH